MKVAAAKKAAKVAVAKRTASASSSSKRYQTPSPSPSDSTLEAEFDLGSFSPARKRKLVEEEDVETLAQRVPKRDKASTGDKPPTGFAGEERQQEEPPRATSNMPLLSTTPPRGASPARASTTEPTHMEPFLGRPGDIDTVIKEVARDAEAEADKIAAEEAAKRTAGTRAPTEGDVFDDEALAAAGLEVVNEPSIGGGGTQEEQLLRAMSANFEKLQALHCARLDKAKSRMAAVDKAEADLEGHVAETQAWFHQAHEELKVAQDLLAERKRELVLKQADAEKAPEAAKEQEEDLAAREEALAATLHGKDEKVEKLVAQQTQELEQRHKVALNAQGLVHAGKVKELEVEWDGLKKQVLELAKEKDTINSALLEGLEGMLLEVRAWEETLTKDLEEEGQLRRNEAAEHKEYAEGINCWVSRLADITGRTTTKLAAMGMPNVRYAPEPNATYLANESRRLYRGALTKVLTKVAFWNPTVNFANTLESLPEEANLAVLKERIKPIIDCVDGVERVESQRGD
nr:uncharacterized protein LOC109759167 [Aegilops tauschii subsp. strangulata]